MREAEHAAMRAHAPRVLVRATDVLRALLLTVTGATWLSWLADHTTARADGASTGAGQAWWQVALLAVPACIVAIAASCWCADRVRWALRSESLFPLLRIVLTAVAAAGSIAVASLAIGLLLARPRDGLVHDVAVLLPLTLLVLLLFELATAVAAALRLRAITPKARRLALGVLAASIASGTAGLAPVSTATPALGAATSGPCAAGAPTASFDVQAINVDIPNNRFGDHDPKGRMYVLSSQVAAVRAQEASQKVSTGLRADPIQPLVIRANEGTCVTIKYTNNADGGDFGLHIDGLAFTSDSSGDAVGRNAASNPAKGQSRTYTYWVPFDRTLEGAHYLRPGPGFRDFVNHGLFGSLVIEPPGSTYLDPNAVDEAHAKPLLSGWEAIIRPAGRKEFRENVQLYHEIGNENEKDAVLDKRGAPLRFIDPHSDAYRPGTRAMNYRSEPFMNRLDFAPDQEAHGYGSYTFGDPATPLPRGYLGDPTKFRILNAGSEMFHVFHLHGGGIRWRFNPVADPGFDYQKTGLEKFPSEQSESERLDSQSFGPGEAYNLEIEGGTGGVQQGAGDFLFHCHIAEHYVAGMWSFWRSYDTRQPEFAPLADRAVINGNANPPVPVDSTQLIGMTIKNPTSGKSQTITAANLDDWIRPQLPPRGVRHNHNDAAVWDWSTNAANKQQYLGEPEDKTAYADYYNDANQPGHPTALPVDRFVGNRPVLLFNPYNGRPAYPLMRPHLGMRPPFSPAGHSGAPYLGENADQTPRADRTTDPWAQRSDGLCPAKNQDGSAATQLRRFNVVAIEGAVKVTPRDTDPTGMIYVLAHDKQAVRDGTKPFEPLALRANVGDCVAVTLTSELTDANAAGHFSQVNMHIHHVQFDTQASDGVISGMSYEQAVRPYKAEDPQLTAAAAKDATVLHLSDVTKFQVGEWIGVGLGTEGPAAVGTANRLLSGQGPEIRAITAIDAAAKTVTLDRALLTDHPAGQFAGVEFTQYRWFPDVDLDNIFWHDHVDGIHTWAHGLVGQLITEPRGSSYHDPRTGDVVDSGTIVDIHATKALAQAAGVAGSFRELALWTMDKGFGKTVDSMLNLRAEPLVDRGIDTSLRFSSYRWGDPVTPVPRAYAGDPFVIRTINVGPTVDTLHVDGHDFLIENRYVDGDNKVEGGSTNTLHYGISEKFTIILRGGAGGTNKLPGDYLYFNGIDRRLLDGAWGMIRVLPGRVTADPTDPNFLQPLPDAGPPGNASPLPTKSGGRPPDAAGPGNPCPAAAPLHEFAVTAIRRRDNSNNATRYAFVPTARVGTPKAGTTPLVMHVAAGECLSVKVKNATGESRIGFHLTGLATGTPSSGVNVGYNPETTIANNATRTYAYFVDNPKFTAGVIGDLTGDETRKRGLYGVYDVAPMGSTFHDPYTGQATDVGEAVDVKVPAAADYRDFSLILADDEKQLGASFMPYPVEAEKAESDLVNYRRAPRNDRLGNAFSTAAFGDPATPILQAYAGDAMVVNTSTAPGSEQVHAFSLGGLSFSIDPNIPKSDAIEARGVGPWESMTAKLIGGAGGPARATGDYFYGDLRRVMTRAGMWGLQRVSAQPATCPAGGSGQLLCLETPAGNGARAIIVQAPASPTSNNDPAFTFMSLTPDANFECSMSTGADLWLPCETPVQFTDLPDGTYAFKVRATGLDRIAGPEDSRTLVIDTGGP